MRSFAVLLAAGLLSCHASTNSVIGAVVMTPLALGASVANRAAGGCYAVCQQGEQCNEKTGFCEALPCRGQCTASETCEEGFFGVKCLPAAPLSVTGKAVPASATTPAAPKKKEKEKPAVPEAATPR
jgi:hypothetical protein